MEFAREEYSIVEYLGGNEGHRCGYCSSSDTSLSLGMWAHTMTVKDYQDLIDRGWRRSGKYVYKPTQDRTCCPSYTIKQEALNFKISNGQKKVIKTVNKYLNFGKKPGEGDTTSAEASTSAQTKSKKEQDSQKKEKVPMPNAGPDPNRPPCKKAKILRMEKKMQKLANKGETAAQNKVKETKSQNQHKSVEDFLNEIIDNPAHKLEVRLVRSSPRSDEFNRTFKESHAVYKNYQMVIHKDPPSKPSEKQYTRFLVDSPLQIKLVRSSKKNQEFLTTMNESYELFKRYQMTVHHESESDCAEHSYIGFLVDSPLQPYHKPGGPSHGYGSFHQQYWLDGQIIMVGVIDILPHCISSVYLYYNPDYGFLSPGTYSALREIAFTRSLHKADPDLKYYYMGFYIHSCPKMRYKAQYDPSFLLCPETYTWNSVMECVPKLDANKYSRFAEDDKVDENAVTDFRQVLVLFERQPMPYAIYQAVNPTHDDHEDVTEYAKLAGKKCAERMLLYRS